MTTASAATTTGGGRPWVWLLAWRRGKRGGKQERRLIVGADHAKATLGGKGNRLARHNLESRRDDKLPTGRGGSGGKQESNQHGKEESGRGSSNSHPPPTALVADPVVFEDDRKGGGRLHVGQVLAQAEHRPTVERAKRRVLVCNGRVSGKVSEEVSEEGE